ncbi:hypothetical protein D3C87_1503960 [compost metagenome]
MVQRQIFNRTAALRTDNVRAPAKFRKAVGQPGAERKSRIAPQIVLMTVSNGFLVGERFDRVFFRVIRITQQEAWHGQTNVAGVL